MKIIETCGQRIVSSVFFFPVKIKSARESHFWPFFDFFYGRKSRFHAHFFPLFHGQSKVFTDTFLGFFTGGFFFTGRKWAIFDNFHAWLFFSRVQKLITFTMVFLTFRICNILEDSKFRILIMIKGSKL